MSRFPHQVFVAAVVAVFLAACAPSEPAPAPVRAVKVIAAGAQNVWAPIQYAGVVTARSEADLGFRVAGKLLQRPVMQGQRVQAGELLAQLDATDFQLSASAAQAQLRAAVTERDLQAADLARYRELRAQNFISAAELDRRIAALKAAESRVEQAHAQLAAQSNQTQYTRLLADADGVVTATLAEPGQVVAAGAPVVRLARDGARDVAFAVPEQRVAQVKVGQRVTVRAWADSTTVQQARVREIAASADPATRTFAVKVEILDEPQPPLGATVTVDWPQRMDGQTHILLPGTAVWRNEAGQNAVWVFDAATQTVRQRPIELAGAQGNDWVVTQGLEEGELVVAAGVHVLHDGERVVRFAGDPPDAPAAGTAGSGERS